MAPPIAFTIPYFLVYRHLELLDTLTGLIIIYLTFNLSLVIWMMRPFYDQLPRSLEEAAWDRRRHDVAGFSPASSCRSPAPAWRATAILCFLFAWNDFFFALILTRTDAMTAPVAVGQFHELRRLGKWGRIAAGGTMIMLPVLVFSFVVRAIPGFTASPAARSKAERSGARKSQPNAFTPPATAFGTRFAANRSCRPWRGFVSGSRRCSSACRPSGWPATVAV